MAFSFNDYDNTTEQEQVAATSVNSMLSAFDTANAVKEQTNYDNDWKAAKAFYNGLSSLPKGILNFARMARDVKIADAEEEYGGIVASRDKDILDTAAESEILKPYNVKAVTQLGQFGLDVVQGAGQLVAQVGLAAATGGAGSLLGMGAQIAGEQYNSLREKGVDVQTAAKAGMINAVIQAPLERIGLAKLMKRLPAGTMLRQRIKHAGENMLTEGVTEFLQEYPEQITNIWAENANKSPEEIAALVKAKLPEMTVDALYSGLIGGTLGGVAGGLHIALDSRLKQAMQQEVHNAQSEQIQERIDKIKDLGANPDYMAAVINDNLDDATVSVDGATLYTFAQEKGEEEIAKSLNISRDELKNAADNNAAVIIKQGNFEATAAKFEGFFDAVKNDTAYDESGYTPNKGKAERADLEKELAVIREAVSALKEQNSVDEKTGIKNFVEGNFDENERAEAQDIIETNISHPVAELRRRKARVQAQIDEILGQTTKELKAGMKNGVDVIEADGKAVRVSNNAPWFQTFWDENKRYPKQYELEQIARDIVTNTTSKYNTEAIAPTSEEEAAYNEELKITLDDLLSQRDMYDSIEGKIKDIQPGDIVATATLSPEARQIYTQRLNTLQKGNKEVSATARAAAILSARMADRLAEYAREAGQKDVTALDFATRVIPNATEDATGGLMQEVNKQAEEIRKKYEGTDQWLKAPNGNDSNLSERLWCVVRTEAFKNWFGDWEAYYEKNKFDNSTPIEVKSKVIISNKNGKVIDNAIEAFTQKYGNGEEINTKIGKITINEYSVKNSLSHGLYQAKIDAVLSLVEGMKKASYVKSLPDFDGKDTINHFFVYKITHEGKEKMVFCRIKETSNQKLYVHEIYTSEDIKKAASSQTQPRLRGHYLYKIILSDFLKFSNDNVSKVVDENGEPLVVYHGSKKKFEVFDKEKQSNGWLGKGFYFTTDKKEATQYGRVKYPCFLNSTKMFISTANAPDSFLSEIKEAFNLGSYPGIGAEKHLQANGYDGVKFKYWDANGTIYTVFNPNQIKSIDNNGNFDADNPNIYYQNKFSRPAGIIKEAGELYQKAVEKFPEIKEEGVENLVKDAIQTTLDFGENNNESNNLQKRSGRTNAGRKRQRTGALRKGQPRRRLAEKQNKRGKFLGLGITRALVNDGAVSLVGNTIHSPADLAEIAQVLRHPGYEKMHYVYVDDTGKIVFHETISCMLPAESAIFSKEIQADKRGIPTAFGEHVLHTFAKYKAVKQYVIHNHPSGDNSPSNADLGVTKFLAQNPDFGGHIILDHNKYTLIDRKGNVSEHTLPTGEIFSYDIPSVENPALGVRISTKSIGQYAAIVAKEAATSVFFTDAKLKIRAVQKLHDDFALVSPEKQLRYLRYCARVCGGDKAILITSDKQLFNSYTELLKSYDHDNGIVDAVYADENGVYDTAFESNVLGREGNKWFGVNETKYAKAPVRLLQNSRGSYSPAENAIRLFNIADQSTFMHESSHAYLTYLQQLAEQFPDSQAAKDYNAIMAWAGWQEGQAREYAGSASASEFMRREAEIQAAMAEGNAAELEKLKNVWAQERFARAFEEYLRSGDAPTSTLQKVFRRFKKWLSAIYSTVTGAGVRATPEIETIMARMIATDTEIEAAAVMRSAHRVAKADPDLLNPDTEAMLARWEAEAKEKAKEVMLKELIAEYETRDVEKHLKEYSANMYEVFSSLKCYQAEAVAEEYGEKAVVDMGFYPSIEEWKKDMEPYGGTIDKALEKAVEEERKAYKETMPDNSELAERAQEAIESGDYNERIVNLEREILARRKEKYAEAPAKLIKAFKNAEEAETPDELSKAIIALKYATKWEAEQSKEIAELQKIIEQLKTENDIAKLANTLYKEQRQENKAELDTAEKQKQAVIYHFRKRIKNLKKRTAENAAWLRGIRDAAKGAVKIFRDYANMQLNGMPVQTATNTRSWIMAAQREAKNCANLIAKAAAKKDVKERDNLYGEAQKAKQRQVIYEAMAHASLKFKKELQATEKHFTKRAKTISNDKQHKIDISSKYYINHLLYAFGVHKHDAVKPQNLNAYADILNGLKIGDADAVGDFELPDWLTSALLSEDVQKDYRKLTLDELRTLKEVIDFLYTTGKNKNTFLTTGESIDDIAIKLAKDQADSIAAEPGKIDEINKYMNELLKPEVLLRILGKGGQFIKYIYKPLFDAMDRKRILQEQEAEAITALFDKYYTRKERAKMTEDTVTTFAGKELTKENILSMALNYGNAGNKGRLIAGINQKSAISVSGAMIEDDVFAKYMTEADWQFVQEVWSHISKYGDMVNDVVEKTTGNPMTRVKPDSFIVKTADGKTVSLAGGYYPIKYDPDESSRQQDNDVTTMAQAIGGASAFGTGMGATKKRADRTPNIGPLLLSLDIINQHINDQIHIASMRIACRDAYKVLTNKRVREVIESTYGATTYKKLKTWAENVWQEPIGSRSWILKQLSRLRSMTVSAIMGYRVSTGMLNLANYVLMADKIGVINTLSAISDCLKHPQQILRFVLSDSAFMRDRAHNIDRDLNKQQKNLFGGQSGLKYQVDKYANWFIEVTDMLSSIPLYYWQYQQTYNAAIAEGKSAQEAAEAAHFEAHAAIRDVLGSADTLDQAAVQREKDGLIKLITPFYSFFNTQMNAVWSKYYEGRYGGKTVAVTGPDGATRSVPVRDKFIERYGAFVHSFLMRFVIMAAAETIIRQGLSALSGDDDKEKDKLKKFAKEWAKNSMDSALGGFPGLRDIIPSIEMLTGAYTYRQNRSVGVVQAAADRFRAPYDEAVKISKGKSDIIDLGRSINKAANAWFGVPDTLTDALWNTARFTFDNYHLNNPDDRLEYIGKSLLDKKLKKK